MSVPFIPDNAPFSEDQRAWLNGFLAGMFSSAPGGDAASEEEQAPALYILFGSQTGNAENLSKQTAKLASKKGFLPEVKDLETVTPAELAAMERVLLITSTYGEGDPPDNAVNFHEGLMGDGAPKMDKVSFSVLALGDRNYEDFCETGKEFDARLETLGGKRVYERVDCDVDFDEPFEKWVNAALDAMLSVEGSADAAAPELAASVPVAEVVQDLPYSKKNPYPAKLLNNYVLNKEGSQKEVRHVEISLEGSGVSYEAGDALGVYPVNCGELVQDICTQLGYDGEEAVEVKGEALTLRKAMLEELDIRNLSKSLMKSYNEFAKNDDLAALIKDKEKVDVYLWGREIIDLRIDYPHKFGSAQEFVSLLKNLQPRLYSISSSPKAHPGEVHLTVGAVRYESYGRQRKGLCSTYLADRVGESDRVRVYAAPNKVFKLPTDLSLPVIMVGPGTGIAPFRAFLEERQATQASGKNWLLFGDQHAATDFLYEEELENLQKAGYLHRLDVAFSRDQEKKIYVQDRMREADKDLWEWLEAGAYFYVCGDASRMAKDVDQALHDVVISAGGKTAEEATAYVKQLKKDKRYVRDVY